MISVDELYAEAEEAGYLVAHYPLPLTRSVSVLLPSGRCGIGIDSATPFTQAEERERLAHEIGHCATGAFYTRYSPVDNRAKCEQTATRYEIKRLLPFDALIRAMEDGDRNAYALAERFGVSEDLILKACAYYVDACGKAFRRRSL